MGTVQPKSLLDNGVCMLVLSKVTNFPLSLQAWGLTYIHWRWNTGGAILLWTAVLKILLSAICAVQLWLSLALVVLVRHEPGPQSRLPDLVLWCFFRLQWCFFLAVSGYLFYGLWEKGGYFYLPRCLRGWNTHAPHPSFPPESVLPWSAIPSE